jgi:2'-5' RNA ligase
MRAFIAIELPEDLKSDIFKKFEQIEEAGLVGSKFVDKGNLHLTLKFLGDISEEQAEKIQKKLSEIKFKKFEAKFGKIGFFPNENYIKIIWIELIAKEIIELQGIIEGKLRDIGISQDDKGFTSHITIARVSKLKDKNVFLEKIKKINIKKSEFIVNKFSFIKSELTRERPIYKTLKEFSLT